MAEHLFPTKSVDAISPQLASFFSEEQLRFDLYEGTVVDGTGTRVIYVSTDLLRGIHAALSHEAGPAWKTILRRCGELWGRRMYKQSSRQVPALLGERLDRLKVPDLLAFLSAYFAMHGWGQLRIDLAPSSEHGAVWAYLKYSLLNEALRDGEQRVDYLVAGMLAGFFSELSGCQLGCLQLAGKQGADDQSVFLVSGSERLQTLFESDADEWDARDVLRRLYCA